MAKKRRGRRSAARTNPPRAKKRRGGVRHRRNPPGGMQTELMMLPVRAGGVLLGTVANRVASNLVKPTNGETQSPLVPLLVSAAIAAGLTAGAGMIRGGGILRVLLANAGAGALAAGGKTAITAYFPESQTFLGRHDDVMYFVRPGSWSRTGLVGGYARPAIAGYAGGLSGYARAGNGF